jgi:uncharacterized Ntn-hydrolase superfamily protein
MGPVYSGAMGRLVALALLAACVAPRPGPPPACPPEPWRRREPPPVATFSIVAYDPETGDLGVAVQSRFLGVGSVVPWAKAGVGAVATQAWANVLYGPEGLALLAGGKDAAAAVATLTGADADRDRRQVGIVDAKGRAAAHTGAGCLDWAGHRTGEGFTVQGNILAGKPVVDAMADGFVAAKGELADRLVEALAAGQRAGGDKRGMQSAALLVTRKNGGYGGNNDRYIDLRVEDAKDPIAELKRLLDLYKRVRLGR